MVSGSKETKIHNLWEDANLVDSLRPHCSTEGVDRAPLSHSWLFLRPSHDDHAGPPDRWDSHSTGSEAILQLSERGVQTLVPLSAWCCLGQPEAQLSLFLSHLCGRRRISREKLVWGGAKKNLNEPKRIWATHTQKAEHVSMEPEHRHTASFYFKWTEPRCTFGERTGMCRAKHTGGLWRRSL